MLFISRVCVPDASVYEEVCASLSKCENCDEGLCSKCPEGLDGPFCSQGRYNFQSNTLIENLLSHVNFKAWM